MRARWLCLAALISGALGGSGCGGTSNADEAVGGQLAVYSSLPLQGPTAEISQQIVNGEKLALADAGGRAGRFRLGYVSLDDSSPTSGRWDPGITASNAKTAAQDTSTIAYLGEYNSAATAISLPVMNAANILQVSPASPYVGLTSSLDAGQDEPGRFYLSGRRTFGRLAPGDPVEAEAQVALMRSLGVHVLYVLDDEDPFEIPLASLVAADAQRAGIRVAAHDGVNTASGTTFTSEVDKINASGAQAVFLAGTATTGAVDLWQQLHEADPQLSLLGSSAMALESFTSALGSAAQSTYVTTPALAVSLYPPRAQRVLAEYRARFGYAGNAYALYGFDTMSVLIDAIRRAGSHGNDRRVVIERFFATHNRASALGRYSIKPNGETTLTRFGIDRVQNGRPVFYRALDPAG